MTLEFVLIVALTASNMVSFVVMADNLGEPKTIAIVERGDGGRH
jgi:hypothetical protein